MAVTHARPAAHAAAFARAVLRAELDALDRVTRRLDYQALADLAEAILASPGGVIVTGMGKAGLVGAKLAATLASTGTPAYPLHPAEALHGDLGRVRAGDIVIALSQSGETDEVLRLIPPIRRLGASLAAITASAESSLGRASDWVLALGPVEEACPNGLAPSASTTAMMAVGDALALAISWRRGFSPEDFALYHPGGSLGRRLGRVEDIMRTGAHVRVAEAHEPLRAVLTRLGGARRRSGAILVVEPGTGALAGIFTDSDLARLFERGREGSLDRPIGESMTRDPIAIAAGRTVAEAVEALKGRKLSELPVLDADGRPVGLIDITDLIGLVPPELLDSPQEPEPE